MALCGTSGQGPLRWVFSGPETAFSIDMMDLRPIKLITYSGSRALRQPDTERSPKKHYLKAIKMHAKRTLFNYGKIFVITRPLPSTIPLPTLFSQPPCLTLQTTAPLMITNSPTSSKRVLSWPGTQTRVSPPLPYLPSPVCLVLQRSMSRRVRCAHGSPCSPSRPRTYAYETGSRSSQGQQEQEECCGHSRFHVRSCPSGRREEEKG